MSVLVVGLSHRSAPVALLEKAALVPERVADLLGDLRECQHLAEAVVVSTCNRVEVYADVDKFHGGVAEIGGLISSYAGTPFDQLSPHLYVHYEDAAVQHVFDVACGLDSMVVGETQILGQLKLALREAQRQGTTGRLLNELVQQALRVGKRAHTETGIDKAGASIVSVGLGLADRALGDLTGLHTLVVGAGSMSSLAATTLRRLGVKDITVVNRTRERAHRLAEQLSGLTGEIARGGGLDQLPEALREADLLVSCTGSTGLVVSAAQLALAREGIDRPLFVLDLALPRDVDPAARQLPGVTLADLETLRAVPGSDDTAADVAAAREIVAEEVGHFLAGQRAARVAPTVTALRGKAAEVVSAELARLEGRLPGLDERTRTEVTHTVQRVVDKLLHGPTVRVKQLAERPDGVAYADVLGELFGLDPAVVEAVTRADVVVEPGSPVEGAP